jgi:hypothetical protein
MSGGICIQETLNGDDEQLPLTNALIMDQIASFFRVTILYTSFCCCGITDLQNERIYSTLQQHHAIS